MSKYLPFEFEFESNIIGIVSSLSGYRLAHFINEIFKIRLHRIEDHEVFQNTSSLLTFFSQFYFKDEINKREFYLIKNKESIYYCLPEFKQFDFLFLSPKKIDLEILKEEEKRINTIKNIQITKTIFAQNIKNKQNIYLDANTF